MVCKLCHETIEKHPQKVTAILTFLSFALPSLKFLKFKSPNETEILPNTLEKHQKQKIMKVNESIVLYHEI
jgi:hypothetical protein